MTKLSPLHVCSIKHFHYISQYVQVLNMLIGGEESSHESKNKTDISNENQSTEEHVSSGSSVFLQKLNRTQGKSVILVWFLTIFIRYIIILFPNSL